MEHPWSKDNRASPTRRPLLYLSLGFEDKLFFGWGEWWWLFLLSNYVHSGHDDWSLPAADYRKLDGNGVSHLVTWHRFTICPSQPLCGESSYLTSFIRMRNVLLSHKMGINLTSLRLLIYLVNPRLREGATSCLRRRIKQGGDSCKKANRTDRQTDS